MGIEELSAGDLVIVTLGKSHHWLESSCASREFLRKPFRAIVQDPVEPGDDDICIGVSPCDNTDFYLAVSNDPEDFYYYGTATLVVDE